MEPAPTTTPTDWVAQLTDAELSAMIQANEYSLDILQPIVERAKDISFKLHQLYREQAKRTE